MPNDISLTVRLPHELNEQLKTISKDTGFTKTGLIRSGIHEFLTTDEALLNFSSGNVSRKDRIVLNINQLTYSLLENACQKHGQSMNAVITAVSFLTLERAAKWLQATKQ